MIQYLLTIKSEYDFIRKILVDDEKKLRKIINSLPKASMIMEITINEDLIEDGDNFLKELQDRQKPDNMVFGKE